MKQRLKSVIISYASSDFYIKSPDLEGTRGENCLYKADLEAIFLFGYALIKLSI